MLDGYMRFRVTPKLRGRAEKVLRVRNRGKANPDNLSDLGREAFMEFLKKQEESLGLSAAPTNGRAVVA